MHHLDHRTVEPERAVADMVDGAAAVERAIGFEPRLYRAPYGSFVPATVDEAGRRGWVCVHWSAIGMDWEEGATASLLGQLLAENGCHFGAGPALGHLHVLTSAR